MSRLEELLDDPQEIIRPALRCELRVVEISLVLLVEVESMEGAVAVVSRSDGEIDRLVDRCGENETEVVVRVFSDEVDPPGRSDDNGLLLVELPEFYFYLVRIVHMCLSC